MTHFYDAANTLYSDRRKLRYGSIQGWWRNRQDAAVKYPLDETLVLF